MSRLLMIVFSIILSFTVSCKKDNKDVTPTIDMSSIIYEVQTGVSGFSVLRYVVVDGSEYGRYEDWNVSEAGTFTKTVSLKKGMLAELTAEHPSSSNWKLRIRDKNGILLNENPSVDQLATPPYTYFGKAAVEIK
jgi:predicted transcriptional regulator